MGPTGATGAASTVAGPTGPQGIPGTAGDAASETLVWTVAGTNRTLTGYRQNGITSTIRSTQFSNSKLLITLASFTPSMTGTATPSSTLNWDVPATGFTVTVDNPSDITDQYITSVNAVTAVTGSVGQLNTFTAGNKTATPAAGVDWTQSFTQGYLRSASSTIDGGLVSAYASFDYYNGTTTEAYIGANADIVATWRTPTLSNTLSTLSGQTFLGSFASVNYTFAVTGISNSANYEHAVSGVTGGTVSNDTGSGVFTFATPLHKDNASATRNVSVTTTFTRPVAVTGTSYTATLSAQASVVPPTFTYPSLWVFTPGLGSVPTKSEFVTGTSFKSGVTQLSNLANTFSGIINNSSGSPQAFWLAVKSTASQPTSFRIGSSAGLLTDVGYSSNTVSLEPDSPPSGYTAVSYNLYGITLQSGNTYVSVS